MNYIERHFGDYAKDTRHLTLVQHGAYTILMDIYYIREQKLPKNVFEIFELVNAKGVKEKRAVETVLRGFFIEQDDGWFHKRCEVEIAKYHEKTAKARASAEVRWKDKRGAANGDANAMRTHPDEPCVGNAHQTPNTKHQTPTTKEKDVCSLTGTLGNSAENAEVAEFDLTGEKIERPNGAIPACPSDAIVEAYHKALPELPSVMVLSPTRKRALVARWREVCAADHLDRDDGLRFFQDFFNRIRQSAFLMGKVPPKRQGERWFKADFDWVLNPTNFIKIVEGKYHGRRD